MSLELLMDQIFTSMFDTIGSASLGVLLIMLVFFLAMLYCGLEFDYSLVIISPIPYAFYQAKYLDVWIASAFIIIPLGIGIYSIWMKFSNKQ